MTELGIKSLFRYSLPLFVTLVPLLVSNDYVLGSASNDVNSIMTRICIFKSNSL